MKKIIFISLIFFANIMINAQSFPYQTKWKEIETAAEKGEYKSLLPQVNAIFAQAKKDGKGDEIVKSLLFQSQILAQTQETEDDNAFKIAIDNFEKAIPQFDGSTKAVLQSLLANIYQQYEQNTRWQRRSITELDTLPKNITEWSSKQILQKSLDLYAQSVGATLAVAQPAGQGQALPLQAEKTENWKQILSSTEDIDLYPTMYDLLNVRYINALRNEKDKNFDKINNLYENLISFHKSDKDKSAFLNFNLMKIEFQNFENEKEKGEKVLALAEKYKSEPFSAYIYYRVAQIFSDNGDKKRAFEICQNVKYDKNNKWSENAKSLIETLQNPNIQINIDNVCLPNEPIAVTVSATNVNKVFYRIYNSTQSFDDNNQIKNTKGNLLKSGSWDLKNFDDFSQHSAIAKLDGLNQGNYCLEIANNQNFSSQAKGTENMKSEINFSVQNISIINLYNGNFQVLDRKTGQPLANQNFKIYKNQIATTQKTDESGIFSVKFDKYNYSNFYYIFNSQSGSYFSLDQLYPYAGNDENLTSTTQLDFFLDRAIYRPGQTVYFKGILYSKLKEKANIVKNQKVTVILNDANYQKVTELTLTTNDYGSFFGEFILPQNGLTGNYFLKSDVGNAYKYFRVEEYKRPKFEVVMDTLKGEFVLEKEIKTGGKAESFAGAPISDAKVVYRVERREVFPYFRWWYPPQPANIETITQSETKTDENGKFEISFTAKPKNAKKKGEFRTYTYTVFADVTDINGETHSAQQSVTVGDLPKMLTLEIPKQALQKDFTKIKIKSTNLNGVREDSKGKITVTQLIAPDRILLPNKLNGNNNRNYPNYYDYDDYYNQAQSIDYQLYTKEEFIKYFPHLPYSADEMNPEKWQRGKVLTFDFDTQKTDTVALVGATLAVAQKNAVAQNGKGQGQALPLQNGFYQIEAYTVFGNDTIRTAQIVEILDNKTLTSTENNFFSVQMDKNSYRVGEQITISFLSNFKDATAILHIESGGKWIDHKQIRIKNGIGTYTLTAKQDFLSNGLFVSSYLLKENGFKQQNFQISVIDKPKDLKISTKTFRNKIKPGEAETWELTISGADKDKVMAEVLATMYDASLDEFAANSFSFNPLRYSIYGNLYNRININSNYRIGSAALSPYYKSLNYKYPNLVDLQNFLYNGGIIYFYDKKPVRSAKGAATFENLATAQEALLKSDDVQEELGDSGDYEGDDDGDGVPNIRDAEPNQPPTIQVRKNLQETAFFYPNLYTDENGDVKLTFTSPEALTKWKLLILAHTQDLRSGTAEFYTQTQKELMVVPNMPRFLREGDEVVISAKINNLTNEESGIGGVAKLFLTDVINNKNIEIQNQEQKFTTRKGQNAEVNWRFSVPKGVQAIEYKIVAEAMPMLQAALIYPFSDGEQSILPVLPNRMLVTETMPIFAKEGQTKTFRFEKLIATNGVAGAGLQPVPNNAPIENRRERINDGNTLQNFNLTFEATTNPLWLAVMSLPYLREYPYECSEQIFSRLYGNILSTYILNQNPKIKAVFDSWNNVGATLAVAQNTGQGQALPLQSNQELKNILLEETPWVRDAQNETEQRKRLALLFDLNKMSQEFRLAQQQLTERQNSDGGFAWFNGGQSSTYITGHIVQGFGQLRKMLGDDNENVTRFENVLRSAIQFIDSEQVKSIKEQEKQIQKNGGKIDGKNYIHYYYVRSFWKDKYPLPAEAQKYLTDINKNVNDYFTWDLQRKAMIATVLYRYGYSNSAKIIIKNLKETSVETDEMGMYWKNNRAGWLWYQSPVEAQTKAIEAISEIVPENTNWVEEMKIWLIKNRQTNSWNSTKATTDAVYALMNFGKDWTNAEKGVKIWVGSTVIAGNDPQSPQKTGDSDFRQNDGVEKVAGYIKTSWRGDQITPEMGTVKVEKTSPGTMWGGMYWQYFEDLDKITQADSNVKMEKSLFIKKNTDNGQKLTPAETFHIGDLVTVRLVIHVDRDMDYIHIKDMRAAGFEPVNVLSGYKYQNGCGYYESTRDAATNFFFERMTKGVYVFEYDVRANNAGTFSNGITTLQNMYAPEMSCHSAGITVRIEN